MAQLEDLKEGVKVRGILPQQEVSVVGVTWHGTIAVEVIYKRPDRQPSTEPPFRSDGQSLEIFQTKRTWTCSAEGELVPAVNVEEDGKLVELDTGGNPYGEQRYELDGWDFASQVAEMDNGGFLLPSFAMSSSPRRQADTWLAQCTATGELMWQRSSGEPGFGDYASSLIRLLDGTHLLVSIANGISLSRVDEYRSVLWRRSLVGESVYEATALRELADGGYLVEVVIQITDSRSRDAILLRTYAGGHIGE